MKRRKVNTKERKGGVALIMSVGILALLAMIATSFAINMQLEYKAATNQLNYTKAAALAEAGIEKAIAELRKDAKENFVYSADTKTYQGSLSDGLGSYDVDIIDEQRKININYANRELLKALLGDSDYARADAIINYRGSIIWPNPPENAFKTIEEIKLVPTTPVIDDATYKTIEEDITVNSYPDPNTIDDTDKEETRCPVNVNTADEKVLKAVIAGISDGPNTISTAEANTVVNDLKSARPFSSWIEFKERLDDLAGKGNIKPAEATLIMNNCNPNRTKPSTYTTDFCFFSGGKYALISTGRVFSLTDQTIKLAEKKLKVIVDIYDIFNQTKKSQFQGEAGDVFPVAFKVNCFDDCPVRGDEQEAYGIAPAAYEKIKGAVKIGLWDDFDEDGADAIFYVNGYWAKRGSGTADGKVWSGTSTYSIKDADGDDDNELVIMIPTVFWEANPSATMVYLSGGDMYNPPDNLKWDDFSYQVYIDDVDYVAVWDPVLEVYVTRGGRSWAGPNLVGYAIYRKDMLSGMLSGIKDEYSWPKGTDIHRTSHERWPREDDELLPINPNEFWEIKKIVKFVLGPGGTVKYYLKNFSHNLDFSFRSEGVNAKSGMVGLCAWDVKSRFDNIRIIPRSPDANGKYANFVSVELDGNTIGRPFDKAEWGTIGATVTIPSSADKDTEKIFFQTSTDGGVTWVPALPGAAAGNAIASSPSKSIQYKANFTINETQAYSGDQRYRETPVLEDVTIICMPPPIILYRREN